MRRKRIKVEGGGYYHLVSRCALKEFLLEEEEKRVFVGMLRRVAAFSGVEVLTHCVMTNHFHILVRIPAPQALTEGELLSPDGTAIGSRSGLTFLRPSRIGSGNG